MFDTSGSRFRVTTGALLAALLAAPLASGQIASALLTEDGPIPGAGGATADALNNTAVNHVGGYAVSVSSSDSLSRVWGNASGAAGDVLRTESTIGDLQQTSFESFYGISNSGQVSYGATSTNTMSGASGLDGVWLDDAVIANEEDASSVAGFFWSFASRPGVTQGGIPYFVGGITDTQGGSTDLRGLFFGLGAGVQLLAGDNVPNLPFPIDPDSSSIDFDYRYSADGNQYIIQVLMDTGSTSDDGTIVVTDAGLLLAGELVREASPIPAAVGGLPGENWDNFDFMGITESEKYFFTGDTDGDSATDEFVLVNGLIQHREGDVLDGFVLSGSIEGAYMNGDGDLAFIWDVDDPDLGNIEALYFNGALLLKEGDMVDWDNDGVLDPNTSLDGFTGISSLTVGDRDGLGSVNIYFTADVDVDGVTLEGFFCLPSQGAECFLVLGPGPGQTVFQPGSFPFLTQIDDVEASWAVLLDDIPEFELAAPSNASIVGGGVASSGGNGVTQDVLPVAFAVQVLMWNPYAFPEQPEQFTPGLWVELLPSGRVAAQTFGAGTGMEIWAEVEKKPDGSRVVRFPFSIPGQ